MPELYSTLTLEALRHKFAPFLGLPSLTNCFLLSSLTLHCLFSPLG
jgi:hypothetical protein